jgi:hypothetical protein
MAEGPDLAMREGVLEVADRHWHQVNSITQAVGRKPRDKPGLLIRPIEQPDFVLRCRGGKNA